MYVLQHILPFQGKIVSLKLLRGLYLKKEKINFEII